MAGMALGAAIRQVGRLFDEGGTAGATTADGPLLGRFLDRGDSLAFEMLVARHGPMVLATARAVLRDPGEAEDAFQATFLALVRKGGSIRGRDALGGWLHRVAHRVAVRANLDAARRRDRERQAGAERSASGADARDEAGAAVHDELARLPDRFRLPVVLCHLEGKTHAQAAAELGWGEATVRRRLADARDRLRHRLTRRGFAPSALLALAPPASTIPPAWVARLATGGSASASASALAMASAAIRAMAIGRFGAASKVALGLVATAGLAVGLARIPADEPAQAPVARPVELEKAQPTGNGDEDVVGGVVSRPDGRPIAGASVGLRGMGEALLADLPKATTGPDGRYEIHVPASRRMASGPGRMVYASAEGFGLAWRMPECGEGSITLAPDDVPIEGRILDLEGRPVAGAEVGVFWIATPRAGVDSLLAAVRNQAELRASLPGDNPSWFGRLPGQPSDIKAGPDGRFRIDGVGRDRIVELVVRGPNIAEAQVTALTRRMDPVVGPATTRPQPDPAPPFVLRGARFDHAAIPSRPITGVVRDRATGKPVAGIRVSSPRMPGKALDQSEAPGPITDAEGRYTLLGHPKAKSYVVAATPPPGSAYLDAGAEVADTAGLGPIGLDIALAPGIPFRVRPVDSVTGEPVEATVEYYALRPNPNVQVLIGRAAFASVSRARRQADGRYAGVMLPGPGAICVSSRAGDYLRTRVDPWAFFRPGEGAKPRDVLLYGDDSTLILDMGEGGVGVTGNDRFHDIVLVNPGADSGPVERDARLLPAPKLVGTVLDPDGRPLAGARAWDLDGYPVWSPALEKARFEATRLDPARPRKLVFRHDGRKLAGQYLLAARGPVVPKVKLQPWATLSGRLVDVAGKPRPGLKLVATGEEIRDPSRGLFTEWVQTGPDGRFRVEGLVPGLAHGLSVMVDGAISRNSSAFDRVVLKPGEDRDLGDIRAESDRR